MAIDIENPGSDLAALREAFGQYTGMQVISSGAITPGATWEIPLDDEYERYHLAVYRLTLSGGSDIVFTFSDGVTDYDGETDYQISSWYFQGNSDSTGSNDLTDGFEDASGYLIGGPAGDFIADVWHNVGSGNAYARSEYKQFSVGPPQALTWNSLVSQLNAATGNVDKMTIFPHAEGVTITGGTYVLWAVKS